MESAEDKTTDASDHSHPKEDLFVIPSSTIYDVGLVVLTGVTGIFAGIFTSLVYLGSFTPEVPLTFGLLIVVGSIALLMLVRLRNERQAGAVRQWESTVRSEQAELQAVINTLKIGTQSEQPPQVFGWQTLAMDETEIAPQLSIFAALFKGQQEVRIVKRFDGGHRNRGVYLVRASGEADRVVKIARSADIRAERDAQALINRFSQNNGGQFVRDVYGKDADDPGGIVYRLASLRRNSDVSNFGAYYHASQDRDACAQIVELLYNEILPHSQFREIYSAAPFQEYAIPERVLTRVGTALEGLALLAGALRDTEWLTLDAPEGQTRFRNPLDWVRNVMPRYQTLQMPMIRGVIHGDLHSENLLIQLPGPNVWIIDFAKTRADAPTLIDYARLEADLKFHLVRGSETAEYLQEALRFEEHWIAPAVKSELDAPLQNMEAYSAEFQKAVPCIRALRRVAYDHHRAANDSVVGHFVGDSVVPYYLALLQATLRTITYEQSGPAQKTFAFLAAGMLCERLHQLVT